MLRNTVLTPATVEAARSNTFVYEYPDGFKQRAKKNIQCLFALPKGNTADNSVFEKYTQLADPDYFMDYLIAC